MLSEIQTMQHDDPTWELAAERAEVFLHAQIDDICSDITFANCHLVAQTLVNTNPIAAKGLLNELQYWADKQQI